MRVYNYHRFILGTLLFILASCDTSDVRDAIDLAQGVPRKTIDTDKLGTNAFVNDGRFGSISAQFGEVKNTLRLNFVRILFAWDDNVQPSPGSAPNFSFDDNIAASIPSGMDAIVVITGVPGWMSNPANWIDGNPRKTFAELWARKVAERYAGNGRIIGYEVWNEQNMLSNPDNAALQIDTIAANYAELLKFSFQAIRAAAPGKLVLSGATTSINQNFPDTLRYNKDMQAAGALDFCDVWSIHYYGKQFENLVRDGGVADFLNDLHKEVWVTESGVGGVNEQLAYGEQVWPFLIDNVPSIARIYQYQFAEAKPSDVTYGMKNLDPGAPVSDLYVYLRDR
jgi:hypothetical protein